MFFVLLTILCLIVALIFLPLLVDEENRGLWVERICSFRWIPYVLPQTSSSRTARRRVVSRETLAKEDAIRAAFVQEKLKDYTKIVSEKDLLEASRHRPSFAVATVIAESGGRSGDEDVEKGANNEPGNATKEATDDNSTTPKQASTPTTSVFDTSRHGTIFLPPAGHDCHTPNSMRQESGTCAICLSAFVANDCITWSSNADCPHLFHAACIQDWLVAVGRKHVARAALATGSEDVDETGLTNFPMLCPCCRRPFIVDSAITSSDMTHSEQGERDASSSVMGSSDSSHEGDEVENPTAAAANDDNIQSPIPISRVENVAEVAVNQV